MQKSSNVSSACPAVIPHRWPVARVGSPPKHPHWASTSGLLTDSQADGRKQQQVQDAPANSI
jgi:hypothetical protein